MLKQDKKRTGFKLNNIQRLAKTSNQLNKPILNNSMVKNYQIYFTQQWIEFSAKEK